jgi:23S rRNA (guanosine2251-2'-O)-methyltransferase
MKARRLNKQIRSEVARANRQTSRRDSGTTTGSDAASHELKDRVYGVGPIVEALRAGRRSIEHILIAEGVRSERLGDLLELAKAVRVPVRRVPRIDIDRQARGVTHQGIIAKIATARYANAEALLDELASQVGTEQPPLALALDGLEDPRNFGAVLRTAECAGVHGIFTTERRAVGLTETVAKAAAGALEYVRVARVINLTRLIEQLKERNIWVVGTTADAPLEYTEWNWTLPTAIFLGNEGAGLHRLVRERCDTLVRIPLFGHLESLNVAVAAGVILFEAARQRTSAKRVLKDLSSKSKHHSAM